MKKVNLSLAAVLLATNFSFSQGTAINTTGAKADSSAMLDVSSTSKGVLVPRMTKANKLAVLNPANGLLVYQTNDTSGFWYYNGIKWMPATGQAGTSGSVPDGVIVMWSGSYNNIPAGWALCDGNNGTPNLINSFIFGVNSSYGPGTPGNICSKGGSSKHNHSAGTLGGTANSNSSYIGFNATGGWYASPYDHNHTITINSGSTDSSSSMPPYFALAYIMKMYYNCNPLDTAETITGDTSVCQSQNNVAYSVPAVANALSYSWIYTGTGASVTGTSESVTINFSATATSGNLTVQGVNSCHTGAASPAFAITVNTPPAAANAGPDQTTGANSTVTLAANPPATGTGQWSIVSGTGGNISLPSDPASTFTGTNGTTYVLRWSVSNACDSSSDEVSITILDYYRVFVTNNTTSGNMGGLSGADALCQGYAAAAGLSGTFKAWLSSSSASAAGRLNHSALPYKLLNGSAVANSWNDLVDGTDLQSAITRNEMNQIVGNSGVYTGTNIYGNSLANTCSDWTSASAQGSGGHSDQQVYYHWTDSSVGYPCNCAETKRLYCFEQ